MSKEFLETEEARWLGNPTVDIDDEPDDIDEDDDIFRVPRSGKRRIYPVERLR